MRESYYEKQIYVLQHLELMLYLLNNTVPLRHCLMEFQHLVQFAIQFHNSIFSPCTYFPIHLLCIQVNLLYHMFRCCLFQSTILE